MALRDSILSAYKTQGGVPSGYRRVEWIQSNGKRYFDLGVNYELADGYIIDIHIKNDFQQKSSMGNFGRYSWTNTWGPETLCMQTPSTRQMQIVMGGKYGTRVNANATVNIRFINNQCICTGEQTFTNTLVTPAKSNTTYGLFAQHDTVSGSFSIPDVKTITFYSITFSKNNINVSNILPYSNDNGDVILYDDVRNVVINPIGTGTFNVGPYIME